MRGEEDPGFQNLYGINSLGSLPFPRIAVPLRCSPGMTIAIESERRLVLRPFLTLGFDKARATDLASWLLTKHHIHVTTVLRAAMNAIRISPNVFTTQEEVDRLGAILVQVAREGIKS